MELLLLLSFLIQVLGSSQNQTEASLDVEVLRFSWSHDRGGLLVSERTEPSGPMNRPHLSRQQSVENSSVMENRIQDLRDLQDGAGKRRSDSPARDTYSYSIDLRNRGTRVIKWIFWDYQSSESADPDNLSHRQFVCAVKVKPQDRERLKAFSALPPRMIISAGNVTKSVIEKAVINRVEYSDGTTWQRSGWHLPDSLPSRSNGRGKCRPL